MTQHYFRVYIAVYMDSVCEIKYDTEKIKITWKLVIL